MDMLPKVGGVDPYQGGAQQRPGTGSFARKKKEEDERPSRREPPEAAPTDLEVDPFIAEMDRLRALDPSLTDSGAHRALLAVKAYQKTPGDPPLPSTDDPFGGVPEAPGLSAVEKHITTRGFVRRQPPAPATGSDAPDP